MSARLFVVAACLVCATGCRAARSPRQEPPKLVLQAAPGNSRAPVALTTTDGTGLIVRELRARVVIEASLAFTELELSFQNPEPRQLEGRLSLRLPQGASIARLALQVGERFQEGELVAQPRAIEAYEEALHGRRDPLLLEHELGNQYQLRIFPIEPHQTKRVIVAYSELLLGAEQGYRLPLRGLPQIGRMRVELDTHDDPPVHHVFERKAFQPNGDLTFALPTARYALESDGLVLVPLTTPAAKADDAPLSRLTLLLDTSASGAAELEQRLERVGQLLDALTRRRGAPFPLQIVAFDQELFALPELRSDGFGAEQKAALRTRGALGATDLDAALKGLAGLPQLGDRVLLYSDGLVTTGEDGAQLLSTRVKALQRRGVRRLDVITSALRFDGRLLAALAQRALPEAGVVIADDAPPAVAQRLLQRVQPHLSPAVSGAAWTYPAELRGVEPGRSYPLFARFEGTPPDRVELAGQRWPLRKASAAGAALLRRAWTQAQIEYLEHKGVGLLGDEAERVRQRMLDLSLHERVLSAQTAWVVLESEADYAQHNIERRSARVLGVERGALAMIEGGGPLDDWLMEEPWLRPPGAKAPRSASAAANDDATQAAGSTQRDASPAELTARRAGLAGAGLGRIGGSSGPASIGGPSGPAGIGAASTDALGFSPLSAMMGGLSADRAFGADSAYGFGSRHAGEAPQVRLSDVSASGALSREVIRRVIQRHLNEIRFCFEQERAVRAHARGLVKLRFIIDASGAVKRAAVTSSNLGSPRTETCMAQATQRWSFPQPESSAQVMAQASYELGESARAEQDAQARERARLAAQSKQREINYQQRPRPTPVDALEGPLRLVAESLARGALDDALARGWDALRAAPDDPMAVLALARAASAHGDTSLAARAYGALIDLYPARAELRRVAGQGLESLGTHALALAIDSYGKALALRPDQPSGLRLLVMALWRAGRREEAHAALDRSPRAWGWARFPGLPELLSDELDLTHGVSRPLVRACLYWENDATDVDLHLYDGKHRYASGRVFETPGPSVSADVERGFGPECISASGDDIEFPYQLQVQYASRGAMGHALGAVHILRVDATGAASFEMRPFVMMKEQAYVDLGEIKGS